MFPQRTFFGEKNESSCGIHVRNLIFWVLGILYCIIISYSPRIHLILPPTPLTLMLHLPYSQRMLPTQSVAQFSSNSRSKPPYKITVISETSKDKKRGFLWNECS